MPDERIYQSETDFRQANPVVRPVVFSFRYRHATFVSYLNKSYEISDQQPV